MAKLYTGRGDDGFTETLGNNRVPKSDGIISLIGELDEFSAVLGVAKAHISDADLENDIEDLQKMLIGIMGELAGGNVFADDTVVTQTEKLTDKYSGEFNGFSVPGVNPPSAYLNLARCVVRRAERIAAGCLAEGRMSKAAYRFLNRLSDLMYAMSRYAEGI